MVWKNLFTLRSSLFNRFDPSYLSYQIILLFSFLLSLPYHYPSSLSFIFIFISDSPVNQIDCCDEFFLRLFIFEEEKAEDEDISPSSTSHHWNIIHSFDFIFLHRKSFYFFFFLTLNSRPFPITPGPSNRYHGAKR